MKCETCESYGFILVDIPDGVSIQRCNLCNTGVTDSTITIGVYRLAKVAIDLERHLNGISDLTAKVQVNKGKMTTITYDFGVV